MRDRISKSKMKARSEIVITVAVFFGIFVPHYIPRSGVLDSLWSVHVSMSIITEGNVDLDEYERLATPMHYTLERRDGRLYCWFPIGTSLVTTPFVYVIDKAYPFFEGTSLREALSQSTRPTGGVQRLIASLLTAISAVLIYRIARRRLNRLQAMVAVFIFAFCTPMWSTASRALWQHGPSVLMLTITLGLLLAAQARAWLVQFAAIPLAMSYVIRPTNSISIAVLSIYVLVKHRRWFLAYLAWASVVVIPFVCFSLSLYGTVLPPYYQATRLGHGRFWEALAGHLVSPNRGLLIFCPVLAASVVGVIRKARRHTLSGLDVSLCVIIVLHWIVISAFPHWWGGYSFGPRFFTDMIPYFVYLMLPALAAWPGKTGLRRRAPAIALGLVAAFSFFVHHRGAVSAAAAYDWNARPADVDRYPSRVWDWSDLQFLRRAGDGD